jgi:hypothetical protein
VVENIVYAYLLLVKQLKGGKVHIMDLHGKNGSIIQSFTTEADTIADSYMANLDVEADRLANAKLYREQIEEILDAMFPVDDNTSERKKNNIVQFKNQFWTAYNMPDIQKFEDSAWMAVNAMSDLVTHSAPRRSTASYNENRWGKIMDGHALFDQFNNLVNKKIAA